MGDTRYAIIRIKSGKACLIYLSNTIMHSSRCPYQIGVAGDKLTHADRRDHLIKQHDIILVGSDGFWDNTKCEEIIRVVTLLANQCNIVPTKQCADHLKAIAYKRSLSEGVQDDITVLVVQIIKCKK
jgi:serine/threonine protein phosphatase PrpC